MVLAYCQPSVMNARAQASCQPLQGKEQSNAIYAMAEVSLKPNARIASVEENSFVTPAKGPAALKASQPP
jgi:hypothetical protein